MFSSKASCVVFYKDSESGLGIEIGQQHPKCRRTPKLTSRANPAVGIYWPKWKLLASHFVAAALNPSLPGGKCYSIGPSPGVLLASRVRTGPIARLYTFRKGTYLLSYYYLPGTTCSTDATYYRYDNRRSYADLLRYMFNTFRSTISLQELNVPVLLPYVALHDVGMQLLWITLCRYPRMYQF